MMKKMKRTLTATLIFALVAGNCLSAELAGVDIHGFGSQGYMKSTDNNFFGETEDGTFDFNEIGVNFGKDFFDKLHLGFQVLSRDFGSNGNNEINLDWGYADYRWMDWLGVRAGRLKAPKGLYNETRDVDMLRATIFLPQSVYPEILREMDLSLDGGGIYGYVGIGQLGAFSYQFMYGTQDVSPNEAASQALQGTTAVETAVTNDSIDVDTKYAASLVYYSPLDGLRAGVTFDTATLVAAGHFTGGMMAGNIAIADFDKYENLVCSVEYTFGDLIVAAEYIRTKKVFSHDFGGGGMGGGGGASDDTDITADGWYLSSSYQFTDWLTAGGYYSESYNDADDRDGESLSGGASVQHRAYFKDLCLAATFMIGSNWTAKLEAHQFTGTNGVSPLDQVADENGDVFAEEKWNLFAAKVTFSF